jgi:hypothetical protein
VGKVLGTTHIEAHLREQAHAIGQRSSGRDEGEGSKVLHRERKAAQAASEVAPARLPLASPERVLAGFRKPALAAALPCRAAARLPAMRGPPLLILSLLLALAAPSRAGPPLPSQLQALVDAAVAARAPRFAVPPTDAGGYFFGASNFTVVGAADFELDGGGATLWFEPGFGLYCLACARVVLRNLTIDYAPLAFAQGTLVSLSPANASFVADFDAPEPSGLAQYPLPDSSLYPWFVNGTINTGGNKAIFWGGGPSPAQLPNQSGVCLWAATWRVDAALPRRYGVALNNAPFTNGSCFKDGTHFGPAVPGQTRVTVSPRDGFALQLVNSSECVVEDVVAYGAGSMAFAEFSGGGGHAWRRLLLTRRPGTQRLLSANADGFQSSSARVGPTLEDSELAFIADDFVNVHSRIAVVLAAEPPDALIIVDTGGAHIPGVGGARAGDALHFFAPYTEPIAPLGGAAVASVAAVADAATWAAARALPAAMNAARLCAAPPCVRDFSQTAVPWRVTFARGALPRAGALPEFALVQSSALQSAGAVLRNNSFHDGFDKCANMNGGNGSLVGNRFERVNAAPCVVIGGYFFWLEGALGLAGVRVESNTFVGLGRDAAEVIYVHDATNVSVKGNVYT